VTDFLLKHHSELRRRGVRRRQHPQRILVSLLVGFALSSLGPKAKPVTDVLEGLTR
jgi:Na+/H+-dicarboxylate symporter